MNRLDSSIIPTSPTIQKAALRSVITTWAICCLIACSLQACDQISKVNSSSFPSSTVYQFTFEAVRPAKEILECDDRTGSVLDSIYDSGIRLALRNLDSIVENTGQGSITFNFAKIDHNSHAPGATLVASQIGAVKPQPIAPNLPLFLDPIVKKQIMAQYAKLQQGAQGSLQQAQVQAKRVEAEIKHHDSKHEPVELHGTDIIGCLLKANDLFSKGTGVQRFMVVVSDLVQNIDVSAGVNLQLPNGRVTVVMYCVNPAKVCSDRKLAYQRLFVQAGAQVTFFDVSQIELVNGVFGN